jgi:hypothetical protein
MRRLIHANRSRAIVAHVRALLDETSVRQKSYAVRVVEIYHSLVPPHARDVHFITEGDVHDCARANHQKLFRMINESFDDSRLPIDLEEPLVEALDEPYRHRCKVDLAARHGLLAVPLPSGNPRDALASLGAATTGFGEVITTVGPTLADGVIDAADRPYLRDAQAALRAHAAEIAGLLVLVDQALGNEALP